MGAFCHKKELIARNWSISDSFSDQVKIDESSKIYLYGFVAQHEDFGEAYGSSGSLEDDNGIGAWFELIERISLVEKIKADSSTTYSSYLFDGNPSKSYLQKELFPKSPSKDFEFAKSNGVATHTDIIEARSRTAFELIERERIIKSWYLKAPPKCLDISNEFSKGFVDRFQFIEGDFGSSDVDGLGSIYTSGVFLFPKKKENIAIYGFGAGLSNSDAKAKAAREAIQRLGFLWEEEPLDSAPSFSPSPSYHQEYFLQKNQEKYLKEWISLEHNKPINLPKASKIVIDYVDLTLENFIDSYTVRAYCSDLMPLVFGKWYHNKFEVSDSKLIHPVA